MAEPSSLESHRASALQRLRRMRRKAWLYLGVMAVWLGLMLAWLVPIGIQYPAMAAPLLVSVAALVWALALFPFTDYRAQWAIYPVLVALLAVIVMHGFLVMRGPFRLAMVFYAVTHLLLWIPFGFLCVFLITKEGP